MLQNVQNAYMNTDYEYAKTENKQAINRLSSMDFYGIIRNEIEEIYEKLKTGETETSYQIGAQSFTEKEWDKLMFDFDKIQDDMRELMRDRHRIKEEQVQKQKEKYK